MTKIVPLSSVAEETPSSLPEPTPEEQAEAILAEVFPRLCNDVTMLVGKPFRLIWDPTEETASTDCQAEVRLAPWFFLEGQTEVGFGVSYHEGGHILFSPYGAKLIDRARRVGGDVLAHIMNLILDRKDDMLNARYAPGFAPRLRGRLIHLCTLSKREQYERQLKGKSEKEALAFLRKLRPKDAYEDFFYAAKWNRRARFRVTHQAMRYVRPKRLLKASPDELLYLAQRTREILGSPQAALFQKQHVERRFVTLVLLLNSFERNRGQRLNSALGRFLRTLAKQYVGSLRASGLKRLERTLASLPIVQPGPISVGTVPLVPVREVKPEARNRVVFDALLEDVEDLVRPLMDQLRRLDNPSEFVIYGQDEGELDLTASAQIATGLPGFHQETVTERDIDAEIHLGLDCSGSMADLKLKVARQITALFSEAMLQLGAAVTGRVWSFNSEEICDFGPVSRQSGFVTVRSAAGNSDTHFLGHVGPILGKSQRRRKVLLLLCDDGPDDLQKAAELSRQLMARGIVVIHLLVGVHGSPEIYPIELLYTSMTECLEEFGDVILTVVKNLR